MNETALRDLLAERAATVFEEPGVYTGVRRQVEHRHRVRLTALAAAVMLVLAGGVMGVLRSDDGRATQVTAGLGWPARGPLAEDPRFFERALDAWGGPREGAALLYAGAGEPGVFGMALERDPALWPWHTVIFEATRDGRRVAVLVALRQVGEPLVATSPLEPRARAVGFVGEHPDKREDGVVVVLLGPGLDGAAIRGNLTTGSDGLVQVPYNRLPAPSPVPVDLYTAEQIVATETLTSRFVIRR